MTQKVSVGHIFPRFQRNVKMIELQFVKRAPQKKKKDAERLDLMSKRYICWILLPQKQLWETGI